MIRLLQIAHGLSIGGLEQVLVNLCRTIDRDRFHVSVLCLRELGPFVKEIESLGINVIFLKQKNNGTDYISFIKVANILVQENIHIIHTHNTQPLIDGTLGKILSAGRQRIIHTDHGRQFPDKRRYMFAEWCMSHFVDNYVAVSNSTLSNLRKFEKIPAKKLMTIENGIDGKKFQIVINKKEKRKQLGLPENGYVIGTISRLEKVKGIKYLLQALPDILKVNPDLTLLIVGDGSEKKQLQFECQRLNIKEKVVFSGNRIDIPEIFQVLNIYLLPSLSEGLPMALIEAMAAGCPIVASRVGGVPETIQNMFHALLISPGKPEEISNAVITLLRNVTLASTFSTNAKKLFDNRYSAGIMTKKYSDLYEKAYTIERN